MTNSHQSCDIPIVVDAARYFYRGLVEAGVEILERKGSTLHSKTMVVDGVYSIVGSVNLNGRSQWRDTECLVGITCEDTARQLDSRFDSGARDCQEITAEKLQRQSWLTRLKQWVISFFQPWM